MQKIIVTVSGGVAQGVEGVPPGVEVEIRDYDNGKVDDDALTDEDGGPYSPDLYTGGHGGSHPSRSPHSN
jgi:hypothetical protein